MNDTQSAVRVPILASVVQAETLWSGRIDQVKAHDLNRASSIGT
jgi:hypothetical protein